MVFAVMPAWSVGSMLRRRRVITMEK